MLIHRDERFVTHRTEARKVEKTGFTRLDPHDQANPLQEKYAVVVDMGVFDALSVAQQIEVKKLIHARPEVRFVFNVMGERRLDPALQELMDFRNRYRNVELRIDPTSFDFTNRQVIHVSKEGVPVPYFDWIERKFREDERFRSVRYPAHDPEAGLITAALLLLEGGKWEEVVRRGQSFSHVPSFLRSKIRQLIDNYVYVSRSA